MSTSAIEWTDVVWNPVTGCSKVSEGCRFCYAETFANRQMGPWKGRAFTDVWCHEDRLDAPLRCRKPRRVFVNSMGDLFHPDVPFGFVMRCLNVMAQTRHTYQILTKRPERMLDFFRRWSNVEDEDGEIHLVRGPQATREAHPSPRGQLFADMLEAMGTPPPGAAYPTFDWAGGMLWWPPTFHNIWLGVSVEDQATANARIHCLLNTPASVRFVSCEPLLGPVDLSRIGTSSDTDPGYCALKLDEDDEGDLVETLDWVIVGGESGPHARPCDVAWIRSIVQQCKAASVPCFVKQLGAKPRGYCSWPHHDSTPPVWLDDDGCIRSVSRRPRSDEFDLCHAVDDAWWPCAPKLLSRKGADPSEWPEDLRVREMPEVRR